MRLVTGFLVLLALLWLPVSAQTPGTPADTSTPDELHVFVREGCPHCASAKEFLAALGPEDLRGVRVVLRDVSQDEQARSDLERLSKAVGAWPPGVPTFLFKNTVLVGFHERKSRYVADMQTCEILPPHVSRLLMPLRELINGMDQRDRLPQILREAQIFLWVQHRSATGLRPCHKLRPNAPQRVNHPFGREASGLINGI